MRSLRIIRSLLLVISLILFNACAETGNKHPEADNLTIGWASADITPDQPVTIRGYFRARVSEGVMDPLKATALAMEYGSGSSSEKVIMISCDLIAIDDGMRDGSDDNLRDNVRELIVESIPGINPEQIILNATHTHVAPDISASLSIEERWGIDLDAMSPKDYVDFISGRIASAAEEAWNSRESAGISYGLSHAVVGHNRLAAYQSGDSQMYGSLDDPDFSHIEGFEDHSIHLLYTWDNRSNLTGVVINIASPSQVQGGHELSADFWHETREELRSRLGEDIFVFAQTSASGDQSPHIMVETKAEERMQKLMFQDEDFGRSSMGRRKQVAMRISDAVTSVLPYMKDNIEWDPVFAHKMEEVELSRRLLSKDDVDEALEEGEKWKREYDQLLQEIEENPSIREEPRWYTDITTSYMRMTRAQKVKERFELEKIQPKIPIEVHVVRIGETVFATNPFELYLDYGIRMKGRSPAVQTFLVQLAGNGTYVPTSRSIAGGAYGAVPASTLIGPEGGQELVEGTLDLINSLWEE